MMIHDDREGRRLVKARPIAEPLRRGHVHGDEALAGPFEARGGNEPVGPGQKHEIARRLLVAGKHARDLFAQLAQGPGEPQRRTKAVTVRAHMTSDDEVVAASASAEAISESVVLVWGVTVMKLVLPILSDGFLLDALLLMLALGIQRLGDGLGLIDGRVHVEAQLRRHAPGELLQP